MNTTLWIEPWGSVALIVNIKLLLKHGAKTRVYKLAEAEELDPSILKLFLEKYIDEGAQVEDIMDRAVPSWVNIATALLRLGANPNQETSTRGMSKTYLLHRAAMGQKLGLVQLLLDKGAVISKTDSNGHTALSYSVWALFDMDEDSFTNHSRPPGILILEYLLEKGADVSTQEGQELMAYVIRWTMECYKNNPREWKYGIELIKILAKHGAKYPAARRARWKVMPSKKRREILGALGDA